MGSFDSFPGLNLVCQRSRLVDGLDCCHTGSAETTGWVVATDSAGTTSWAVATSSDCHTVWAETTGSGWRIDWATATDLIDGLDR